MSDLLLRQLTELKTDEERQAFFQALSPEEQLQILQAWSEFMQTLWQSIVDGLTPALARFAEAIERFAEVYKDGGIDLTEDNEG